MLSLLSALKEKKKGVFFSFNLLLFPLRMSWTGEKKTSFRSRGSERYKDSADLCHMSSRRHILVFFMARCSLQLKNVH